MMKHRITHILAMFLPLLLIADVVELKDGTRIEGRILKENKDSVEIQVGANEAGTIRRVLIIHSSEISTWMADEDGRMRKTDSEQPVHRLDGTEYIERLLRQAEGKIQANQVDASIDQFLEAADIAGQKLEGLDSKEKFETLKLRAHALRLALAALEGKKKMLESKSENVLKELEDRRDNLTKEWSALEDAKKAFEKDTNRRIEMGRNRDATELEEREEKLRAQMELLKQQEATYGIRARQMTQEAVRTEAQITLIEERVDQAEDDVKMAEREIRRR